MNSVKHHKAKPFIPSRGQIITAEKFKEIIGCRIAALTVNDTGCPILQFLNFIGKIFIQTASN